MRHVVVQRTGRRIHPFDDPMDDVLVHGRPLVHWRRQAFADAGFTEVDHAEGPHLVVPDTLLTTGAVLDRLWAGAGPAGAVLALRDSAFGRQSTAVQPDVVAVDGGWRFDAVRVVGTEAGDPALVWIDPEEQVVDLDLPAPFRMDDRPGEISLPRHPVITLHHWAHVLWANQAWAAAQARALPAWRGALSVASAVLRARSLNKWRILGKLNRIGRGCDIHPTATVEGSTLGDGVTVGAYARVIFSHLGDGATVMPGAHVEASTLCEGATAAQMTGLRACVLYPGAFHGQSMMQASVVGRDALTTLASYCIDLSLDGTLKVPLDDALHDLGTNFLGAAVGHRARLGTGVWLAPGRAIPNDTLWIRSPDDVARRVPSTTGAGPWVTRGGTLARLRESDDDPR